MLPTFDLKCDRPRWKRLVLLRTNQRRLVPSNAVSGTERSEVAEGFLNGRHHFRQADLSLPTRIRAEAIGSKHNGVMPQTTWEETYGRVVKVESISTRGRRQLIVTFSYEAQGHWYEGEFYTFKSMSVGEPLIVKYDASNPQMTGFKTDYARKWRIWWIVIAAFFVTALLLMLWINTPRH